MAVWVDFEHLKPDFEPPKVGQRGHKGSYGGPKMVQNGSKMIFSKMGWESITNILEVIWTHFEAFLTVFQPANGPNYNGNRPFWDQKWLQNGSKMTFFKIDWGSIGNTLGPFWNHFEAFLTILGPANGPNYNGNGPFWVQKRVKKGSKMTLFKTDWELSGNIVGSFSKHFEAFSGIFKPSMTQITMEVDHCGILGL